MKTLLAALACIGTLTACCDRPTSETIGDPPLETGSHTKGGVTLIGKQGQLSCACSTANDCQPAPGPCAAWSCVAGACVLGSKNLGDACVTSDSKAGVCRHGDPLPYGYCFITP